MATSPNFNWPEPDNTDLVKNGALAIRTAVNAIDASLVDLKGGTTGQVLAKASGTDMDFSWVAQDDSNAIQNALLTTTGDTIYASGASTPARLGIGTTGQVLTVAGGVPSWATPAAGGATLVGCVLNRTTDPSIADSTWTTVTYDAEKYDTDGFHSTSTNTERITIPTGKGGKYQIFCNIIWADSTVGRRQMRLMKNGSELLRVYGPKPDGTTTYTLYTVESLAATDYIEIQINQASGGALTAYFNGFFNYFGVNYIGA